MTFAAWPLRRGEAPRMQNSSPASGASYSSRTKGQDREATDRCVGANGVLYPLATYAGPIKDVAPFPRRLADLQRRRGFLFISGLQAGAVGYVLPINRCGKTARNGAGFTRARLLKLNVRQELAGQAHRCGTDVFPRTESFVVSFTGLSVFHDRNHERRRSQGVVTARHEFGYV